jgi:DNA-binding MarR family transcriptional regulator
MMTEKYFHPGMDVYEFIRETMDTVPHLEALMLLWNSRPVRWTSEELASRLYISPEQVTALLRDLIKLKLVAELHDFGVKYSYFPRSPEQDEMMRQVDLVHRSDLIRISTMIHSKKSSALQDFARAFRFKKERE